MSDKYDVILADPPWEFKVWTSKHKSSRAAAKHYPTMSIDEINALPIANLISNNAVLFLWMCWPLLPEALSVIDAWGFKYKTIGWVWVKAKASGFGFHYGLGYYGRANTEPCLLAVKGRMPVARHDIQALMYAPVREHSRKPEDQYRKIESLYPGKRYLELFARREREGWDVWGNEVDGIELP